MVATGMTSLLIDVVPVRQIQNVDLMKAFGFRTEVTVDDCLSLLQHWGSNNPFLEARCEIDAKLLPIVLQF